MKPARGTRVGRILKTPIGRRGYKQVTIRIGEIQRELYVHSLVAATFLGPRPLGYDVNHIDADKTNNRVDNLEYVTRQQNTEHARKLGRMSCGEACGKSHLKNHDIIRIRRLAASMRVTAIAKMFRVSHGTVSDIILRKTWKHVRGMGGDGE